VSLCVLALQSPPSRANFGSVQYHTSRDEYVRDASFIVAARDAVTRGEGRHIRDVVTDEVFAMAQGVLFTLPG